LKLTKDKRIVTVDDSVGKIMIERHEWEVYKEPKANPVDKRKTTKKA